MIVKDQAAGPTVLQGLQIFNKCRHILITSSLAIPSTAVAEIRLVNTAAGQEKKLYPKGKLSNLAEFAAQRCGYFTDKIFIFEVGENADLVLNGGFLIIDMEGLSATASYKVSTLEDLLGRETVNPIVYDRMTVPSGVKVSAFGMADCDLLALPNTTALVQVTLNLKSGKVVRYRLEDIQALQRMENDLIVHDTTAAFGATTFTNGYKDWLTVYATHVASIEIETDGTALEFYQIKNLD